MSSVRVYCQTRFEGFHCWPDAPDEVAFLRDLHRHEFRVRLEKVVEHNDRDIEFILLKREVEAVIVDKLTRDPELVAGWSCESWATYLGLTFDAARVEVSEDGENGAIWEA